MDWLGAILRSRQRPPYYVHTHIHTYLVGTPCAPGAGTTGIDVVYLAHKGCCADREAPRETAKQVTAAYQHTNIPPYPGDQV